MADISETLFRIESLFFAFGLPLIFISSFIEITPLGWTIPGGMILVVGGFFSFDNIYLLLGVLMAGWLGAWLTFLFSYLLGNKTGLLLVKKLNQEKNAQKAKKLLAQHGGTILTTSMLANLTRFWIAYIAGVQKYNFLKFLFYSGSASLAWVSLHVVVGFLAGSERQNLENILTKLGIFGWTLFIIAVFSLYIVIVKNRNN